MTLRTSLMVVCLTATSVLAQTPPAQSPPTVRSLPVTKVVLYKTGLLERYARQLDAQETQLETLTRERESLSQESEAAERKLREFVASLSLEIVL